MSDFVALAREIGQLVHNKQEQYGDAFGKAGDFLALLYPNGVAPHQYRDALCIVRIFDKLCRVAQRKADGKDLGGESPYGDIAGYGLLGLAADKGRAAVTAWIAEAK